MEKTSTKYLTTQTKRITLLTTSEGKLLPSPTTGGHMPRTFGNFRFIDDVQLFNAQQGYHYFSPNTMRAFGSRCGQEVYGGCVFTESIHNYNRTSRVYRVKVAMSDGSIETWWSDAGSSAKARREAKKLGKLIQQGKVVWVDQDGFKEV